MRWLCVLASAAALGQVTLEKAGVYSFEGRTFASSSSLILRWQEQPLAGKLRISVTSGRDSLQFTLPATATEYQLTELKSATDYAIRVDTCDGDACTSIGEATARTEDEYWRVVGTGNSFATAKRLIRDGNVNASALRYGTWAGPLAGQVQLYYNPIQREEKGAKVGEMLSSPADIEDAFTRFEPVSGFGLLRICDPNTPCPSTLNLASAVALFQPVPMADGKVRLFFEAQGSDGRTRILYLDSQDGWTARDFHRGEPTRCASYSDYSPAGGCEPALAIGVDLDGNANLRNARQFKIGYANRDGSAWDGSSNAWMLFTTEYQDRSCSEWNFNFAFANWNGDRWVVQYGDDGCPKLMKGQQAMAVMHLGEARYKMYYNQHTSARPGPGPVLKPIRLVYGDGAFSGDPDRVDFEDWEDREHSRPVHFLWPDGTPLTEEERSRFDDMFVYMPTGDWQMQVMYSNMSQQGTVGPPSPPFLGSAILVNP